MYTRNTHVDFTREPIIETVITPREGYRLVVRSSKSASQEEHFVDALEVVSFGNALFFRSLERPKPFIVPSCDYEVLEVREPRIVLKTPIQEKAAAPREHVHRAKVEVEKKEPIPVSVEKEESSDTEERAVPAATEGQGDRRRERRRPFRRRRGQNREEATSETSLTAEGEEKQSPTEAPRVKEETMSEASAQKILTTTPMLSSILPPPTLVRDNLAALREKEEYKGAFFIREDKEGLADDDDDTVLEGLRSDEFLGETESRDQEVSPEEPFCDPFFEEKNSEAISRVNHEDKEDMEPLTP